MPGPIRRLLPFVRVSTLASTPRALGLVAVIALALTGCGPADPIAEVAAARGDYEVRLSGWIVRQPEPEAAVMETPDPAAGEATGEPQDQAAEEASSAEGAGEEAMEAEADPRLISVLFDILVLFSGSQPLPGLTVDITHADSGGNEKAVRQHYIEVGGLVRGSTNQVAIELDGWDLADGDAFSIEVRHGLSDAERAGYREFQEAGAGAG